MAQPQKEWWELVISWVDTNKVFISVTYFAWKGTDGWFKFLTRLVDGRLKKVAEDVFEEKMKPLNEKFGKFDEKLEQITQILLNKK